MIFQQSLNSGEVPRSWLDANVTHISKKGAHTDPNNYRPISLASIICKLLEKIVKKELISHLTKNNLICDDQHGFVPSRSFTTNLLESLDLAIHLLAKKLHVDMVFLDFEKAFDKVHHPSLLIKLEKYGITGNILNWIKAYLSNRIQRVVLGDTVSDWSPVVSGVPQGSVLWPTLFAIFINDLPDDILTSCKMFANDTKLIAAIRPHFEAVDRAKLQYDIDRITEWCNHWYMSLNTV